LKILWTTHDALCMKANLLKTFSYKLLTTTIRWGYRTAGDKGFGEFKSSAHIGL
jgi:hypothetical protein